MLSISLFVLLSTITPFITKTAYADYTPTGATCDDGSQPTSKTTPGTTTPTLSCADSTKKQNGAQTQDTTSNTGSKSETCAVEKIGWFLCPVMEQSAKISDKAFAFLANNFLRTDPQLVGNNNGTKTAWEIARNLANVMFIIAFLAIIVSQVTGMGINNYGIKKMLPRLIVAAIAVNVSYYICQLIVDLTNILGYEIQNALAGISNSLGPSVFGNAAQFGGTEHTTGLGTGLEVITVAALAATGIVFLIMGPLLAVVMMVIITVITVIVILLLRKALIVLLVVVSPIAFVLYLLPNTEKLFSKWLHMFTQILLVFPVVGLLFGAGQLASTVILVSGAARSDDLPKASAQCNPDSPSDSASKKVYNDAKPGQYDGCGFGYVTYSSTKDGKKDPASCGNGCSVTASWVLGLVAAGVAVVPLVAVWAVLKGALAAAGTIGGKVQAGITKGGGNVAKRSEAADQARQNRMALRAMQNQKTIPLTGGVFRGRARRDAIRGSVDRELKHAQNSYIAGELTGSDADDALQKKMAGGYGVRSATPEAMSRVETAALNTARSEQSEALKAASELAKDLGDTELRATISGDFEVNDPKVAAAINELGMRQDFRSLQHVLDKIGSSGQSSLATRTLAQTISQNTPELMTGGQVGALQRGALGASYADTVRKNLEDGILSAEKMASAGPSVLAEASGMATSAAAKQALINSAYAAVNDPILSKKISRNAGMINNFSQGKNASGGIL